MIEARCKEAKKVKMKRAGGLLFGWFFYSQTAMG